MRKTAQLKDGQSQEPIDNLPGLGIVRVRALRKAGYETVGSLRSANEEQLTAVPGITAIKARQILEQLQATTTETPAAPVEDQEDTGLISAARGISLHAT